MVVADKTPIGQILRNLIGIAATYPASGTPIDLRVMDASDRMRIENADIGAGVLPI